MDNSQLINFYKNNNIPNYHGSETLDALKYLSELDSLPGEVREDYYSQYASALARVGTSYTRDLGKLLYDKFYDKNPMQLGETVNTYTYKGVTLNAIELKIPRFGKLAEYFAEHGISVGRIKDMYVVIDIVINNISTLQLFLNKSISNSRYCLGSNMFFLIDDREWAILNGCYQPYNGIGSFSICDIFKDIVEKSTGRYQSYNSSYNIENYITMLIKTFDYHIDVTAIRSAIKDALK